MSDPVSLQDFEKMTEEQIFKLDGQTCLQLISDLMMFQKTEGPNAMSDQMRLNCIYVIRRSRQLGGQASESKRAAGKPSSAKKPSISLLDLSL